ncbi:MAG: ChuX/HutX family heme-like substrate-binding protein [Myxococcota bacterium]
MSTSLHDQYRHVKQQQPNIRIRDAAQVLSVSELELVALGCGDAAIRLQGPFAGLLKRLDGIGSLMGLTRNQHCVHEKTGPYEKISMHGAMGLALGEQIDLRLFLRHWVHGFAVTVHTPRGPRKSLQFFDAHGQAVHKIYVTDKTDDAAWNALITDFTADDQSPVQAKPEPVTPKISTDHLVDADALRQDWSTLKDTHDFFGMLRKHKVSRTHAVALVEGDFTARTQVTVAEALLTRASEQAVPIMAFVGNRGCIQIHSGPVKRILITGDWVNVMDPAFNLHLRQAAVAEAWVVRKPTVDGIVTSVELFDDAGEVVVRFFGVRKPGQPERADWRALAGSFATPRAEAADFSETRGPLDATGADPARYIAESGPSSGSAASSAPKRP